MAHICMQRSLPLHTIKEMQIKNTRRQLFCNQQMHNSQRQYKVLMRMCSKNNNFFEEQSGNTQSNQRHVYVLYFQALPALGLCVCVQSPSCVGLFATLWAVASQAPLSVGFPRQEHWSGVPSPFTGDLPDPGIEPAAPAPSPALQADSLTTEPRGKPKRFWAVILKSGSDCK